MKKNYYLILLFLVLGVVTIAVLNTRSNKKKDSEIREDVARIQSEIEPKLMKLMELKSNLKEQINKLQEDVKGLKDEAKKELKGQKEAIKTKGQEVKSQAMDTQEQLKSKVHDLKEEAKAKRDVLEAHAADTKNEAIHEIIDQYHHTVEELESLEAELSDWKADFTANLKAAKNKASKATYTKLEAARNQLRDINDRIVKAIEKTGQAMQHHE